MVVQTDLVMWEKLRSWTRRLTRRRPKEPRIVIRRSPPGTDGLATDPVRLR